VLHRIVVCALALLFFSTSVFALEVGLESLAQVSASDNVTGANKDEEQIEGQVGNLQFGVFGEQKGARLTGGFAGEIYSTRRLDDPEANFSAITQFIGAADFKITPRSFSWYVGDILGSVRSQEGLLSIDEADDERRNVFVTGPQFVYELDGFSRVNANFYYVNQTEDDVTLESLFNTNADWSVDTDSGNTWGVALTNVFTDNAVSTREGDFNRFSLAGTWTRNRARNTYSSRLGVTRYDTKSQSLNGVNAQLSLERQLSAQTVFSVSVTRDLRDDTLNVVESLVDTGSGERSDSDGVFDETRLDFKYALKTANTTIDLYSGVGMSEFRLLSTNNAGFISTAAELEDRTNFSAGSSISRAFTARIRANAALEFSQLDFTNLPDNSQSVLGEVQLVYRLTRSFEAQLGYRFKTDTGKRRRSEPDEQGMLAERLADIDSVENRISVGLRWAPPTRATKDLTVQLKSLLQ